VNPKAVAFYFHGQVRRDEPQVEAARRLLEERGIDFWEATRDVPFSELRRRLGGGGLVLTLGGDGTFLEGAQLAARAGIPQLGVNLGRLGFLTEVDGDALVPGLERYLAGDYRIEERTMLQASIVRDGHRRGRWLGLNEAVLNRGVRSRIMRLRVAVDGLEVGTIDADGAVIATATGSTAYALALGGPIMEPALRELVLVPMSPFALTVRPIVFSPSNELTLSTPLSEGILIVDGRPGHRVRRGDSVAVAVYDRPLQVVRFGPPEDFFRVLRHKLGWGAPLVPFPEPDC
jgi:NAD+ kinase